MIKDGAAKPELEMKGRSWVRLAPPPAAPLRVLVTGGILALIGLIDPSAAVGEPANVRLTSYNMDLVLSWDPPEGASAGLLYTAALR